MAKPPPDNTPVRVCELVVNLDDVTGEVIGHAAQTLLEEGALDVWTSIITMKHGRPGTLLSVLTSCDLRDAPARRLLELTGSFGVRYREWDRLVLDRTMQTVSTALGDVPVKVGSLDGKPIAAKPEFREVVKLAQTHGVSIPQASNLTRGAAASLIDTGNENGEAR